MECLFENKTKLKVINFTSKTKFIYGNLKVIIYGNLKS